MKRRKVVMYVAMSLDGYLTDENGDVGVLDSYGKPEDTDYYEFLKTVDVAIMGRTTYDEFLKMGEYPYIDKESYVLSRKRRGYDGNVTYTDCEIDELVKRIRKNKGKNIWLVGGASTIHQFREKNLIDEYHIVVFPVLLGKGLRLFSETDMRTKIKLVSCDNKNNTVILRYKPIRK